MRYAINVCDLTIDSIVAKFMVAPLTPNRVLVSAEPGDPSGSAVVFDCSASDACDIIATIRMRYTKTQIRCYESAGGVVGWSRI